VSACVSLPGLLEHIVPVAAGWQCFGLLPGFLSKRRKAILKR
jgi:hypothetical protein